MAHKIDNSTGKDAFVSYKQPAWHGLGEIFTDKKTAADLLVYPELNYSVKKCANVHRLEDGTEIVSDNSFFTYREDTKAILGDKVGANYHVVQNSSIIQVVEGLGNHWIETAGCLDGGRVAFVAVKFDPIEISKDTIDLYYTFFNSHDGSLALSAMLTPVRVVCNNTLQASLRSNAQWIKIRHTESAEARLEMAAQVLKSYEKGRDVLTEYYSKLQKTDMKTDARFFDFVAHVFCTNQELKDLRAGQHPFEVLSTRKQNVIKDVLQYAETGPGQDGGRTAWGAYNAVTGYYANVKSYSSAEQRFDNLMLNGSGQRYMDKALHLAGNLDKMEGLRKTEFTLN